MNVLQAAEKVLEEVGMPLHYKEITRRMIDSKLWQTRGKTPDATVNAEIAKDIKRKGEHSLFQRTDKGVFALRNWRLPEFLESSESNNKITHNRQPLMFLLQSCFLLLKLLSKY